MKNLQVRFHREGEKFEAKRIYITNGDTRFLINIDVTGKLRVNKIDLSENTEHSISVNPCSGNEILLN